MFASIHFDTPTASRALGSSSGRCRSSGCLTALR
jgi:hypothetical protein